MARLQFTMTYRDWHLDPIHSEDNGRDEALWFSPHRERPTASDGFYIHRKGSTVEWGWYEGAFPHIGEAFFQKMGESLFKDTAGAKAHLLALLGGEQTKYRVTR